MKTEVKKLDGTKRELSIEISGDTVKNKFEEVFKRIAKDAKVRGFRSGNVPRDILEKHYSSFATSEVLKELIPDVYNQVIEREKLDVVGLPDISDVKLDRDNLLFKATVEVNPDIKVKNYKGIKVNYKKTEVAPDEIKRNINSLKDARKGPQSETQRADNLDDSFAQGLGYPNLSELEKAVERQIFIQKDNLRRHKIENEIVQNITKDLDFKLPQSLVDRQLQSLVRQAKLDLALKSLPPEKIEEQEKTLLQELESEAKRQVKLHLVMAEIARIENIPLDDHMPQRVMEFLLREADWIQTL